MQCWGRCERGDADVMLRDIAQLLQTGGIGTLGADLFLGQLPDSPDNCVAVFEYAGGPPDLHWGGEYPGLQVLVRNKSYEAGRAKIEAAKNVLHGLAETKVNNHRYLLIRANQSPFLLERDASDRVVFVCNFSVIKEG